MYRFIVLFDTSSLPDSDTVDSATMELVAPTGTRRNEFVEAGSLSMVASTPASNTNIVSADYAQLGTVKQATDVTLASLIVDSATYNAFTLNATGLGNINKTGVTKFGMRTKFDNDNTEPTVGVSKGCEISWATAEEILAGDKRPKLVVTHTAPPSTFVPKMLAF